MNLPFPEAYTAECEGWAGYAGLEMRRSSEVKPSQQLQIADPYVLYSLQNTMMMSYLPAKDFHVSNPISHDTLMCF